MLCSIPCYDFAITPKDNEIVIPIPLCFCVSFEVFACYDSKRHSTIPYDGVTLVQLMNHLVTQSNSYERNIRCSLLTWQAQFLKYVKHTWLWEVVICFSSDGDARSNELYKTEYWMVEDVYFLLSAYCITPLTLRFRISNHLCKSDVNKRIQ